MAIAVVTVAAGGLPVVDVTVLAPRLGLPVNEGIPGRGIAVTKVVAPRQGLAVIYTTPPLLRTTKSEFVEDDGDQPLAENGA